MPRTLFLLALLALAFPAAAQPDSAARAHEPVVLEGRQLPALLGTAVDHIAAYRREQGGWAPIPVQVDERAVLDVALAYRNGDFQPPGGCNAECQQIFGSIGPMPYWTDPDTWIGPDTADPAFDADDELVFMARDGGERRTPSAEDPPGAVAGSRVELRLTAPEGGAPTYVYLFAWSSPVEPPTRYVSYDVVFCHKQMQTPSEGCNPIPETVPYTKHYDVYGRGGGPHTYTGYRLGANPEDTSFEGDTYRLHFSDRWILDSLALGPGGPDLIDRLKVTSYDWCGRTERSASLGRGAFIVNRAGPVRALRAVIGFNSFPLTQRHHLLYDRYLEQETFFRGHPIQNDRGKNDYFDYAEGALGMYYYSNLAEEGVPIDGWPDPYSDGPLTWEAVRGHGGSTPGTVLTLFDPYVKAEQCEGPCVDVETTGYFEDRTQPRAGPPSMQCTGDTTPLGASGFRFLPTLPNTDPRPSLVNQHGELYHIQLHRRTVLSPENLSDEALGALRDRLRYPLRVTVNPADTFTGATASAAARPLPEAELLPPRPNPVAGRAVIPFSVTVAGPVRLALYDGLGREVLVLVEGDLQAGWQQATLDAAVLPAGTYRLRLTTPEGERVQAVTLVPARMP